MECSGKHRGLGVHLSFVRSVSMDKWKDIELEKMKVGGNRKAREFFESQPDWNDGMSISQRYNTKAAALYRDKIATLARGEPWSPSTSAAKDFPPNVHAENRQEYSSGSPPHSSFYHSEAANSYQNGNSTSLKSQTESFFARKQTENASRPDNIPPNQGGKYGGFGYQMDPPPRSTSQELFDTAVSSLASGWSIFSSSASKIASKATENAIKIGELASQKVRDGTLLEDVGAQVNSLAAKVGDLGRRGWGDIGGTNSVDQSRYGTQGCYQSSSCTSYQNSEPTTPEQQWQQRPTSEKSFLVKTGRNHTVVTTNAPDKDWEWDCNNQEKKNSELEQTRKAKDSKGRADGMTNIEPADDNAISWDSKLEEDAWEILKN